MSKLRPLQLVAAAMLCTVAAAMPVLAQNYSNRRPLDNSPRYGQPYQPAPSYREQTVYKVETWTGFYLGGHVGGGWGSSVPKELSAESLSYDGFVGGGHFGYNWQMGPLVLGAELDASLSGVDGMKVYGGSTAVGMNVDWTASVRGRLGFAWDQFLFYGTAGIAFAGLDLDVVAPAGASNSHDRLRGFVYGGGVEMKINPNLSARVEALRYNFDDEVLGSSAGALSVGGDMTTVRAGLTWHFN